LKNFYNILFLLLICVSASPGQIQVSPILSDPHRQGNKNILPEGNFRMAAGTSINSITKVKDTLKLPFFDDFTSITPPIDSFHNQSAQPVRMTTYGLHGLYNGDKIFIFGAKTNANLPSDILINTTQYVKRIDPFTVELYSDPALTVPVIGTNSPIINVNRGTWIRSNYKWSPNPDTLKWVNGGGVYINDRYGVSPPSYNVATFDGLDANGKAYSFAPNGTNIYAKGDADTLTSLPINLLPYLPSDSLVLSFYWQGAGLGEMPDLTDSINLQMKNKNGAWKIVWSMKGDSTAFKQVLLTLKDPLYFYNGFQFRFHSYGKISGSFDVWNLDYILLNKNRTITDATHRDIAISDIPVSILKDYTAIPYKDFFRAKALQDSGHYTFKNLQNATDQLQPKINSEIKDEFTNHFFQTIPIPLLNVPGLAIENLAFKIDPSTIINQNHPVKLKYLISASTSDDVTFGADYRSNDSASSYNMLDNYYAYDDSSAEGYAELTSQGELAIKYTLTDPIVPDTLIAVDIYFPHILADHFAIPFVLTVWQNIDPENVLKQQSIALNYENLNQFKRYMLDDIVIVTNSFYVGLQQSSLYKIPIGFDFNTDSHTNVFYNVSGSWVPFTSPGSFMIRPVFGSTVTLPTSVFNPRISNLDCEVFPNPGNGIFQISGDVDRISITDLSGRVVLEKIFSKYGLNNFDASSLPEGLYLMRIFNENSSGVKKIVISK
jgi:hypothetical protein